MCTNSCGLDVLPDLPRIDCPIAAEVHPAARVAHEQSLAWAHATGLASGPEQVARLGAARIGWLAARGFPRARAWALQLASDWTTLFCLLDDHVERIVSPAAVEARLAGLMQAFTTRTAPKPAADPFAEAFVDLRARMDRLAPPCWIARFSARLAELFACFAAEATFRARGCPPDPATYVRMREVSVGLHLQFPFSALTDAIELPPEILHDPAIASLEARASNLVGWANDILTYEKEVAQGEVLNFVVVLQAAEGLSARAALARVVALHNAEMRAFVAEVAALPSFGADHDEAVRRHVAIVRGWVPGHLAWGVETGRYRPGQSVLDA